MSFYDADELGCVKSSSVLECPNSLLVVGAP